MTKRIKLIIAILLISTVVLSLSACSSKVKEETFTYDEFSITLNSSFKKSNADDFDYALQGEQGLYLFYLESYTELAQVQMNENVNAERNTLDTATVYEYLDQLRYSQAESFEQPVSVKDDVAYITYNIAKESDGVAYEIRYYVSAVRLNDAILLIQYSFEPEGDTDEELKQSETELIAAFFTAVKSVRNPS